MPYCPLCQREPEPPDSRCPLDQAFYVQAACPACGSEVFPKERFCGACGARLEGGVPRLAAPLEPASAPARVAALLMDGIALGLLVEILESLGGAPHRLAAAALVALAYFTLLQTGGRQTLGQHVMSQVVLGPERTPMPLGRAAARTLAAALAWITVAPLFRPLVRADRLTAAEAWTGSRTWHDRHG